jgi:hypothetical protein
MLMCPQLGFALLAFIIVTQSAIAQEQEGAIPSLIKPADAVARMDAERASEMEAYTLGVQTVLWGMQWVKVGQTLRVGAARLPQGTKRTPVDPSPHGINIWGHAQALATHELRIIETPNTETLYSIAILDLQAGPIVVVHPGSWRALLPHQYLGASWRCAHHQPEEGRCEATALRAGSQWLERCASERFESDFSAQPLCCDGPHIAVYGTDDLPNVHVLQKGFKLVALKDWGSSNKELEPGQPMRPLRRPNTATPAELLFFEELCETLKDITPRDDELGFARQAGRIGITLADGFQFEKLEAATVAGLKRAVLDAQSIIEHKARILAQQQPGGTWMVSYDLASLDDWLFRSAVGWKHVWGDLPSEALFPMVRTDVNGQPLTGKRKYTLHFPAGQLPPARYWRISMYDLDGFFVSNPIRRYGIGNMAEKR